MMLAGMGHVQRDININSSQIVPVRLSQTKLLAISSQKRQELVII